MLIQWLVSCFCPLLLPGEPFLATGGETEGLRREGPLSPNLILSLYQERSLSLPLSA